MYVNHGTEVKGKDKVPEREKNCGMCTIAAMLRCDTLKVASTLGCTGQSDKDLAIGLKGGKLEGMKQLEVVLKGMIELITKHKQLEGKPVIGMQFGAPGTFKSKADINAYIESKPIGSEFAVWGCQSGIEGMGAHWNYAITLSGGAEYRDYQDNYAEGTPFSKSSEFIAPRSDRPPDFEYTAFIALCFVPVKRPRSKTI